MGPLPLAEFLQIHASFIEEYQGLNSNKGGQAMYVTSGPTRHKWQSAPQTLRVTGKSFKSKILVSFLLMTKTKVKNLKDKTHQ